MNDCSSSPSEIVNSCLRMTTCPYELYESVLARCLHKALWSSVLFNSVLGGFNIKIGQGNHPTATYINGSSTQKRGGLDKEFKLIIYICSKVCFFPAFVDRLRNYHTFHFLLPFGRLLN